MFDLLYKRLLWPVDGGHTHTQTEYYNPHAHARQALMMLNLLGSMTDVAHIIRCTLDYLTQISTLGLN